MTDLVTRPDALPALADTPSAAPLDSSDVAWPRLRKGEGQSPYVQTDQVPKGCIFTTQGQDDPDPEVLLADARDLPRDEGKGVLVHVVETSKNKALKIPGGEFTTWDFNDPSAHPDAKTGYQFTLCLPEDLPGIPVKVTLASTSSGTAKRIIFRLLNHRTGPQHELAFRLTLKSKSSEKGGEKYFWFVWMEEFEEAKPENVAEAESLARLVASIKPDDSHVERSEPTNQPAI